MNPQIQILLPTTDGIRLDSYLSQSLEGVTRSSAQRLLESGFVVRQGKLLKKSDKTLEGVEIEVTLTPPVEVNILPQNLPLDVMFEDDHVIVLNKEVGMVVHPAPGHPDGTLVNALLHHCGSSLSGINGELRPGIVHRIDRDTSGLLIVAKNDSAHLALSSQLQDHSLYREYEAVCIGNLKEEEGTLSAPIGRHPTQRKKMTVDPKGRDATTHWKVLTRLKGHTHIQCRLETGRTHQIRVHLAHTGHPLLGDTVYGSSKPYPGLIGQCLHARRLSFSHPVTGENIQVEAPLPNWFEKVLTKLTPMV